MKCQLKENFDFVYIDAQMDWPKLLAMTFTDIVKVEYNALESEMEVFIGNSCYSLKIGDYFVKILDRFYIFDSAQFAEKFLEV